MSVWGPAVMALQLICFKEPHFSSQPETLVTEDHSDCWHHDFFPLGTRYSHLLGEVGSLGACGSYLLEKGGGDY